MSGARVFIGTRTQSQTRLIEVWSYEDAQRFPWTFLARNLPTVADIGLRKLVKLISRIPGGKEAKGVGREAVEEWLGAPKAFGMRAGKGAGYGYNAGTDTYEDLVKAGVIDPTKVVRSALQNAASVAGLLLTTDALVSEVPGADKEPAAGGHAH